MKQNNILITVLIVIIVGGAAFFGGMKYQQSKSTNAAGAGGTFQRGQFARGQAGGNRAGGQRGGFGGATVGEVVSVDANSITLKLQDGSSKIVNISDATTFSKTDTGTKSDVKTGDRIAAIGSANSDGSISAQNVQLNPMFRNGPTGQVTPTK